MKDLALIKELEKEIEDFERKIAYYNTRIDGNSFIIDYLSQVNENFEHRVAFCLSEIDRLKRKCNEDH